MSEKKRYIGDAVYADIDRGQILLTTDYGMGPTNQIYLDDNVMIRLVEFIAEYRGVDVYFEKRIGDNPIENLIGKVVIRILKDPKLQEYVDLSGRYKPASHAFEDAAGNHVFDDHFELFGITENEGHQIRAYFQQSKGCRYDADLFAKIDLLINQCKNLVGQ